MAPLDNLPPDQRAVLQMVLQRGRSYDQIAQLLSIDRAAVRQRALAALDALGPATAAAPERRALITDYLLGQLPPAVADSTRQGLAESPAERAWARVIASELAPLASGGLPEIPASGEPARAEPVAAGAAAKPAATPAPVRSSAEQQPARRSSRRGGALLLGVVAIIVVAVAVVLILNSGSSSSNSNSTSAGVTSASTTAAVSSAPATGTTSTSTTSTPSAQIIAQFNLAPPLTSSKAKGAAFVVRRGTATAIVIQGQSVPANTTHDAYAVWLYNSPTDSHILGFVSPGVGSSGRLSTAGELPTNAAHFKQLLVTLETQKAPKQPGKIVLQGELTGVS